MNLCKVNSKYLFMAITNMQIFKFKVHRNKYVFHDYQLTIHIMNSLVILHSTLKHPSSYNWKNIIIIIINKYKYLYYVLIKILI